MVGSKHLDNQYDVVVIGAGMSGLTLATALTAAGKKVLVLEKARGSGGRLSSKRIRVDEINSVSFDLGCSTFSAESDIFRQQVNQWIDQGAAASIHGQQRMDAIVGVPRNSSITRLMADALDVRFSSRLVNISRYDNQWLCELEDEDTPSYLTPNLVLAVPPQQLATLLPQGHAQKNALSDVHMQAQWVLMLELDEAVDLSMIDLGQHTHIIEKINCDSNKPNRQSRSGRKNWLIHAASSWTADHLDVERSKIALALIRHLEESTSLHLNAYASYAHRWLYSTGTNLLNASQSYIDLGSQLYGCGDWACDQSSSKSVKYSGVEAAYLSGSSLARKMITTFK